MTEPATVASCYRHPDRSTNLACSECDRPICPSCSINAAVGQRCPDCVRARGRQTVIDGRRLVARSSYRSAPVTFTLISVAVAFFALGFLVPRQMFELEQVLVMSNLAVAAGEWWRMLTVVLLHAGTFHIAFNMLALYNLGPQIEREVGGARFLSLYLASAAAGSALAFHLGDPSDIGVGASGAIFGLFGIWLASAVRRRGSLAGRALLNQLIGLLVLNAAIPFFVPIVAWEAHLGGLVAGFALGWIWSKIPAGDGGRVTAAHLAASGLILVGSILSTQI